MLLKQIQIPGISQKTPWISEGLTWASADTRWQTGNIYPWPGSASGKETGMPLEYQQQGFQSHPTKIGKEIQGNPQAVTLELIMELGFLGLISRISILTQAQFHVPSPFPAGSKGFPHLVGGQGEILERPQVPGKGKLGFRMDSIWNLGGSTSPIPWIHFPQLPSHGSPSLGAPIGVCIPQGQSWDNPSQILAFLHPVPLISFRQNSMRPWICCSPEIPEENSQAAFQRWIQEQEWMRETSASNFSIFSIIIPTF